MIAQGALSKLDLSILGDNKSPSWYFDHLILLLLISVNNSVHYPTRQLIPC